MGKLARLGRVGRRGIRTLLLVSLVVVAHGGCQLAPTVPTSALVRHRALIDFVGLKPTENCTPVKVSVAPPRDWEPYPIKKTALYTHEQWRSPTVNTAVGVLYVRLPIPLSAKTISWIARGEYTKKANDGKLLAEWTDSLGRPWFEAENKLYHCRGYVLVRGLDAWFIYCGYKLNGVPTPADITLAARSLETIVPLDDEALEAAKRQQVARADATK